MPCYGFGCIDKMQENEIEQIEVNLLLEAIHQRYGYDFKHYARASMERRVRLLCSRIGCHRLSEMIPQLLHDDSFLEKMIREFSITVTDMFRDPFVYRCIREQVVPMLKTYPYIKVWLAGCATGEEVYSMAILLQEEGLYEQSIIYATDFNDIALGRAKDGIYQLDRIQNFSDNYKQAGGLGSLSDYYQLSEKGFVIQSDLKKNITFANHNLVTDSVFGEMQLIICRNVLIYFDKTLQERVLQLFRDSLTFDGFLCLGSKESLRFSLLENDMKVIDAKAKVYQKKVP